MIKGVNKNIIEISDTGNDCFERAILFLKPESRALDKDMLSLRARAYVSELTVKRRMFKKKKRLKMLALVLLVAVAVVGAYYLLNLYV